MGSEEKAFVVPDLPDEAEYPRELTDNYELLECCSEKETSRTLVAKHRKEGTLCVVKCYLRDDALYGHSEPEMLQRLDAAPMPRFLAEYRNERMRCVLREYVPGDTLAALAEHRCFTEEEVLKFGLQLCDQLAVLHDMSPPVIHRDIKPQNIVVQPDGTAVLIDFGIARAHTEKEMDTVALGTQGFAPPEQYGFSQTDSRSDIYSLGILLFWLLHHETRISGESHTPLDKVIAHCSCFDPERRFADVKQVKRALLRARPACRRKRSLVLSTAMVLLLALAAVGIGSAFHMRDKAVTFSQPLIEQAVRLNLGLEGNAAITSELLPQVTGVYVVAGEAYPDSDAFYSAVNRWYAEGRSTRGSMTELTDLSMMPNLEEVCIVAQELEDISVLSSLTKLSKVELKHNYITDIAVLAGMNRLTYAGLNDNPVRDISPLTKCPNLAFLDLCSVRSYEPSIMRDLGNFDFLDISNPTESYRYLDGKSILDLRIAWSGLDDLHDLDHVTRLERLEIDHTEVPDLSPLAVHTGLKVLKIGNIPVTELGVLKQLPQLEEVYISADMKPAADALGDVPFVIMIE